jgi:hypothetical protein
MDPYTTLPANIVCPVTGPGISGREGRRYMNIKKLLGVIYESDKKEGKN